MKKYLIMATLALLLIAPVAQAANVVRAFVGLTGGTAGMLDNIVVADLANGDISIVVVGDVVYIYQYHSAATDPQSSPTKIRPKDYSTAGVHYLVSLRAAGIDTGRVSEPCINFYDSDCTDNKIDGKICLDCSATGSGAETCAFKFYTMASGTLTLQLTVPTP